MLYTTKPYFKIVQINTHYIKMLNRRMFWSPYLWSCEGLWRVLVFVIDRNREVNKPEQSQNTIYRSTEKRWESLPLYTSLCKCIFPMNPQVRLLVGWSVRWPVGLYFYKDGNLSSLASIGELIYSYLCFFKGFWLDEFVTEQKPQF